MASEKQRSVARKNIKKATRAAKRKQTLKHLPKKTRRALGNKPPKLNNQNAEWLRRSHDQQSPFHFRKEVKQMSEEHEARQPYKCAVCGAKFDSQDQLQNHLKSCTQKK
jgi:hypothetical protein